MSKNTKNKASKKGSPNPKALVEANPPKCVYSPLVNGKFDDAFYSDIQEMINDVIDGDNKSIDCIVFVPVKVVRIKNEVTIKDL